MVDKRELGDRLRILRLARRWSLTDAAERANVPATTLSRWENGRGKGYPELDRLGRLASVYEVDRRDLLWDTRAGSQAKNLIAV
jgi:transcriptional regulator with XRE-family HTH domain